MRLKIVLLLTISMCIIGFCCKKQREKIQNEYEVTTVTDTVYVDTLHTMPVDTVLIK